MHYQRWSAQPSSDRATDLADAVQLRRRLRRAGVLLEKAAAFHADWQNMIAAVAGGYRAGGRLNGPPTAGGSHFSLRG